MSRRYGRNQKRKAREQISKLTRHLDEYTEGYNRDVGMLRRQLDNVRQALGPNFIGLPPETLVRRACELGENYDFRYPALGRELNMQSLVYRSFSDSLRHVHQLHFRVELAGHQVGYAISAPALLHAPADWIARGIGHEIARLLVHDLRKAGAR